MSVSTNRGGFVHLADDSCSCRLGGGALHHGLPQALPDVRLHEREDEPETACERSVLLPPEDKPETARERSVLLTPDKTPSRAFPQA